jgi:hypothetical protein
MRTIRFAVVAFALFCLLGGSATAVVFHQAVVRADRAAAEQLSARDAAQFLIALEESRRREGGRYVDVGRPSPGRPYALARDGGRSVLISAGEGSSRVRCVLRAPPQSGQASSPPRPRRPRIDS